MENWKSHIIRTVNQDLARTDMFDSMSECQAVMVIDCAMTFLPCSHRQNSQIGMKIKRYDYSEAQSEKPYCDAKIANLRQKIRMYVANGNNVTTADEMKQAIDKGLGVVRYQYLLGSTAAKTVRRSQK
ncbi:Hypothetical predicted protein [Mytilus galloprovincialis]|uniref:Uncharacterized protein n=1 Tax=Mytilus galloprovincialis TaxID=29158 RepID=A0A8B6HH76_MYTGA|nr:Hypothetical predicted protein [Mytilus galloprovincialis]